MEHNGRIQRAIDYIEENLKDELPIESIAGVACFSMWHFQRVFGAIVGDSVKEYVRKRRLASALSELTSTDRRILDIAVDHQFESQESFTRAFKAVYGKTPGECRKAIGFGANFISPTTEDKSGYIVIRELWQNYAIRANEIKGRKGYGIGLVESLPDARKSQVEEYWYLAGSEVEDFTSVPVGMVTRTAPAGRYAVFPRRGTPAQIEHTLRYIYGSWLPKSGEELRNAPTLTCREENHNPNSEDAVTEIYIPVK